MTVRLLVAAAMLVPAACVTRAAQEEQPAIIFAPTEASRAELRRIVSAALNGRPVTLADDALTRDSTLTIERRTPAGEQGRAATGRTLEATEQFTLVLRGTSCLLVRAADGREWQLADARCVPAGAR